MLLEGSDGPIDTLKQKWNNLPSDRLLSGIIWSSGLHLFQGYIYSSRLYGSIFIHNFAGALCHLRCENGSFTERYL